MSQEESRNTTKRGQHDGLKLIVALFCAGTNGTNGTSGIKDAHGTIDTNSTNLDTNGATDTNMDKNGTYDINDTIVLAQTAQKTCCP